MMAELPQVPDVAQVAHVALPPPVAKVDAVKQAAAAEIAKAETARAVADLTAQAHLARAKNSTIVTSIPRRPIVSAPPLPQRRSRTPMLITAVTVIVVVIGAAEGARRFGLHSPQQGASEGQQVEAAPAVNSVTHAARPAKPSDTRSAVKIVAENRAPAIPMAQAALSPKPSPKLLPKPTAKPTPKPTPKAAAVRRPPVRQANSSNQRVVPVVAPAAPPATLAPVPASPTAAVAVNSPRASAPPVGRLFERKDVDQPPQVATRVAPKLPANVPDHMRNGTVVVRVLVSRTGHASSVSLLRGSMLGRSSDEAVIAAVTQWTFSPAKKQGEPVNCWFNIGVPLAQAN
jgi:periplasmic protein TonB